MHRDRFVRFGPWFVVAAAGACTGASLAGAASPCPGDLDGSGVVDGTDLAILLGAWGACPAKGPCPADLTGDGEVDGADLSIMLGAWGACASGCESFAWIDTIGATGLNAGVRSLALVDLDSGASLYAGGTFTSSGDTPIGRIAQWNGTAWSEVGGGVNNAVRCLA